MKLEFRKDEKGIPSEHPINLKPEKIKFSSSTLLPYTIHPSPNIIHTLHTLLIILQWSSFVHKFLQILMQVNKP